MERLHPKLRKLAQLLQRASFATADREDLELDGDFDPAPVYRAQATALATCNELRDEFHEAFIRVQEQF